jgi:predicted permease
MSWKRFFHRTRADQDHAQEFQAFLELETEENIARGMTPEEARRAAHLKFGNATSLREEVYEGNSIGFLETLGRDVRYAIRTLKAKPAFTIVSLLTLALGIGATTAIFTVVNGVILRPLPYPDPDRLVTLWETNPNYNWPGCAGCIRFSPGNYLDVRDQNRSFAQIGALTTNNYNLTGGGPPDRIVGGLVSASLFSTLGLRPALGRVFVQSDDSDSAERVVVLSHSLWMRRFGGNTNVIGTSLRLDDRSHTIIGVLPAGFRLFDVDADLWLPIERKITPQDMHWRWSYYLRVIARLKPGISLEQARQDADRIMQDIRRQFPGDLGKGATAVPMLRDTVARAQGPLTILFGAVGFVLLIACANVANLNLGRAAARRREIAVRLALGASRSRLVRQLFTESMVLALCGGALGLAFAKWGVSALLALAPREIPRAADIHVDAWVFGFALLAAGASALIFGLFPAMSASKADPQDGLKGSDRSSSAGPATQRARNGLAISEIAIALVLLIGAGLMIESFRRLLAVAPGFNPRGLITMRVPLSRTKYESSEQQTAFYRGLLDRVRNIAGVNSLGAVDGLPFSDGGFDNSFTIDGRPEQPGQHLIAEIRRIDQGYFSTMQIPLLQGRGFNESDRAGAPPVAIVSQAMARRYWPGESPIGKRLTVLFGPPGGIHAEIVGLVSDVRSALDAKAMDYIYLHYPQGINVGEIHLVVRSTAADTSALARAVRGAASALDPDQPVYRVRTMDEVLAATLETRSFQMFLLGSFAALAACLAAIGLYGVLAYQVQARTREIGIRTALGATNRQVFAAVLRDALRLIAIGLAAGLAGAFALTRVLTKMLFGVEPTDPATFALVSGLLLVVSLVAAYVPARRAARVDPLVALRYE